eukprot:755547-Hanusia_phi.AAC.4
MGVAAAMLGSRGGGDPARGSADGAASLRGSGDMPCQRARVRRELRGLGRAEAGEADGGCRGADRAPRVSWRRCTRTGAWWWRRSREA